MTDSLFTKILVPVDFLPAQMKLSALRPRQDVSSRVAVACDRYGALATFNQLGLLAVPSDAQGQKLRRHYADSMCGDCGIRRSKRRRDANHRGRAVFVEIAKTRMEKVDLVVMGSYGGRSGSMDKSFSVRPGGCGLQAVGVDHTAATRKKR